MERGGREATTPFQSHVSVLLSVVYVILYLYDP